MAARFERKSLARIKVCHPVALILRYFDLTAAFICDIEGNILRFGLFDWMDN